MLNFLKAENIFDVVRPLHRYSRAWGLTAFGIEENRGKSWKAKLSVLNCVHVILLCAYLIMLGNHFVLHLDELILMEGLILSNVIKIAIILATLVYCFSVIAISLTSLIKRKSMVNVINIIADVDKEFLHHGFRFNYPKHKNFIIFAIISWFFFTIATVFASFFLMSYVNCQINMFLYLSLVTCVHFIFVFYFQFVLLVWCIKTRFRQLNKFLCTNFTTSTMTVYRDDRVKLKNLNLAARLHELLVMACECFNEGFGIAVSMLDAKNAFKKFNVFLIGHVCSVTVVYLRNLRLVCDSKSMDRRARLHGCSSLQLSLAFNSLPSYFLDDLHGRDQ